MKTKHDKVATAGTAKNDTHSITITGRSDEFPMVVDALMNSQDERVQKMGQYIRKAVGIN